MNLAALQNAASGNSNLNSFTEHSIDQTLSEQLLRVQLLNVLEKIGPSPNAQRSYSLIDEAIHIHQKEDTSTRQNRICISIESAKQTIW